MAYYGYIFGNKDDYIQLFEAENIPPATIENLHIESFSNSESRPVLESLFDLMTDGDILVFPSFEHIGNTMSDVILTIDSLAMMNITINLIDLNDSSFFELMGGSVGISQNMKSLLSIQNRLMKRRQARGIERAKEADAALPDWKVNAKKYKGRVGVQIATKLKVAALRLNGKRPTEIANMVGISRGSVYNYISSVEATHPTAIAAYKYLCNVSNFELKPCFTYHNVGMFLLDIYLHLMNTPQKEIRKKTYEYQKSGYVTTCNQSFLEMVKTGKLNKILNLNASNCRHFYDANLTLLRLTENVNKIQLDTMMLLYTYTDGDMSELITKDLKDSHLIATRIYQLTDRSSSYSNECFRKLFSAIGVTEPSDLEKQITREGLQAFITGGEQDISIATTINHYTD
ncbi:hypothetical protein VCRA2110O2_30024 [Vibrio crassostreae]|nr:hypothetical protein VCHA44O286_50353 [Vibrio chagasii]CAK2840985.1 hypothetical protein VCRA2110O2_30024 [Vibrio crassostreae]